MKLNAFEIEELYRLADDLQRDGNFEDAENLRELLDSRKTLLEAQDALTAAGIDDEPEDVVEACESLGKALDGLDGGETSEVIKACSVHDDLKKALELAADETSEEAGNFDDNRISLHAELDRLEEVEAGFCAALMFGQAIEKPFFEVRAGLKEVVSVLEGQRDRLKDTAKRAREAHAKAGK